MNVPEAIGKYVIKRQIGRGAMGVVLEAYDSVIERRVAVKLLRADLFEGSQMADVRTRFKREAHSAGRLSHPHIVTIYDYGEHDGVPYIVMDYMEGKELSHHLEGGRRLPVHETVRIMTQLLAALAYAHDAGIVHRDVKPANIFVLQDGSLKVVDFGVARIDASELTDTGAMLGTPAYMSPEQFLGLPVDARSDLFSCGVILYQLLTGDKPFTGSVTTIMQKVLRQDPVEPSALNPTLDPAWDAVVERALAKKPDERFVSARQFSEALQAAAQAGSPVGGEPTLINLNPESSQPQGERTYEKTVPLAAMPPVRQEAKPPPSEISLKAAPAQRFPYFAVVGAAAAVLILAGGGFAAWQATTRPAAPAPVAAAPAPTAPQQDPAKLEAEMRAKLEVEVRQKIAAEAREKAEAEKREKAEAEAKARADALRARQEAARKAEGDYWRKVEASTSRADYEEYLRRYPDGPHADEARARIRIALQAAAPATRAPAPSAPPAAPAAKPAAPAPVAAAPAAAAPPAKLVPKAPPVPAGPQPYRGKVVQLDRNWGFVVVESQSLGGIRTGDRLAASLADGRRVELTVRRISGNLVSATPEGKLIDELLGAAVSPK